MTSEGVRHGELPGTLGGGGWSMLLAAGEAAAPGLAARFVAARARRVPARVRAVSAMPGADVTALRPAPPAGGPSPGLAGMTESSGSGPLVFLVPGYHGTVTLRQFVPPLVRAGYRAVTVRVPGHCPEGPGRYGKGILPEFTAALEAAERAHGTPFAIIGHCLGAYAAQISVLGRLRATRCLVLIEALPDAHSVAAVIARHAALGRRTRERLPLALARQAGITLADADAAGRAREDEEPRRVLAIWDNSSQVVPAEYGLQVAGAWAADSHRTSGLGHTGVLRSEHVHKEVIGYLDAAGPAARVR
jgi:hypothetical protein